MGPIFTPSSMFVELLLPKDSRIMYKVAVISNAVKETLFFRE
jgi:hypothetical protein